MDDNGCATDPTIFGEWEYERSLGVLTAVFNAFKFPASNNISFQCNIRVCFGQCQQQEAMLTEEKRERCIRGRQEKRQLSACTGQLGEEIMVQSNSILTIVTRTESRIDLHTGSRGMKKCLFQK